MAQELIPTECAEALALHEAELDTIWPGWRKRERFDRTPRPLKIRIKWLLKRRLLLLQGRNVEVLIVWKKGRTPDQDKPFAHPVLDRPYTGDLSREPAPVDLTAVDPDPISSAQAHEIPLLALKFRLPVERVEEILSLRPPDSRVSDGEWITGYLSNGGEALLPRPTEKEAPRPTRKRKKAREASS